MELSVEVTPASLLAAEKKLTAAAERKIMHAFRALHQTTLDWSPVNTGKFARNWNASEGAPVFTDKPGLGTPTRATNTVDLPNGTEEFRPDAEDESISTQPIKITLGRSYFLANGSEFAGDVEYGRVPTHPHIVRNAPLGTLRRAVIEIRRRFGR